MTTIKSANYAEFHAKMERGYEDKSVYGERAHQWHQRLEADIFRVFDNEELTDTQIMKALAPKVTQISMLREQAFEEWRVGEAQSRENAATQKKAQESINYLTYFGLELSALLQKLPALVARAESIQKEKGKGGDPKALKVIDDANNAVRLLVEMQGAAKPPYYLSDLDPKSFEAVKGLAAIQTLVSAVVNFDKTFAQDSADLNAVIEAMRLKSAKDEYFAQCKERFSPLKKLNEKDKVACAQQLAKEKGDFAKLKQDIDDYTQYVGYINEVVSTIDKAEKFIDAETKKQEEVFASLVKSTNDSFLTPSARIQQAYKTISSLEYVDDPAALALLNKANANIAADVKFRNTALHPSLKYKFSLIKRGLSYVDGANLLLAQYQAMGKIAPGRSEAAMEAILAKYHQFISKVLDQKEFGEKAKDADKYKGLSFEEKLQRYIKKEFTEFVRDIAREVADCAGIKSTIRGKAEKRLEKDLRDCERFANWKRRSDNSHPTATVQMAEDGVCRIQVDSPIKPEISPALKKEFEKINSDKPPYWFKKLSKVLQNLLLEHRLDILAGKFSSLPATLRSIPFVANFTKHQVVVAQGDKILVSEESIRRSTIPPINVYTGAARLLRPEFIMGPPQSHHERNRLAALIAEQVYSAADPQQTFDAFWAPAFRTQFGIKSVNFNGNLLTPIVLDRISNSHEDHNLRFAEESARAMSEVKRDESDIVLSANWPINSERDLALGGNCFKDLGNAYTLKAFIEAFAKICPVIFKGIEGFEAVNPFVGTSIDETKMARFLVWVNNHKADFINRFAAPNQDLKCQSFIVGLSALGHHLALLRQCEYSNSSEHYKAYTHRNIQLFSAAHYTLMARALGGKVAKGCKSAKDRLAAELVQVSAMDEYYALRGELPSYSDDGVSRDKFTDIWAAYYKSGQHQFVAGESAYGADACLEGRSDKTKAFKLPPMIADDIQQKIGKTDLKAQNALGKLNKPKLELSKNFTKKAEKNAAATVASKAALETKVAPKPVIKPVVEAKRASEPAISSAAPPLPKVAVADTAAVSTTPEVKADLPEIKVPLETKIESKRAVADTVLPKTISTLLNPVVFDLLSKNPAFLRANADKLEKFVSRINAAVVAGNLPKVLARLNLSVSSQELVQIQQFQFLMTEIVTKNINIDSLAAFLQKHNVQLSKPALEALQQNLEAVKAAWGTQTVALLEECPDPASLIKFQKARSFGDLLDDLHVYSMYSNAPAHLKLIADGEDRSALIAEYQAQEKAISSARDNYIKQALGRIEKLDHEVETAISLIEVISIAITEIQKELDEDVIKSAVIARTLQALVSKVDQLKNIKEDLLALLLLRPEMFEPHSFAEIAKLQDKLKASNLLTKSENQVVVFNNLQLVYQKAASEDYQGYINSLSDGEILTKGKGENLISVTAKKPSPESVGVFNDILTHIEATFLAGRPDFELLLSLQDTYWAKIVLADPANINFRERISSLDQALSLSAADAVIKKSREKFARYSGEEKAVTPSDYRGSKHPTLVALGDYLQNLSNQIVEELLAEKNPKVMALIVGKWINAAEKCFLSGDTAAAAAIFNTFYTYHGRIIYNFLAGKGYLTSAVENLYVSLRTQLTDSEVLHLPRDHTAGAMIYSVDRLPAKEDETYRNSYILLKVDIAGKFSELYYVDADGKTVQIKAISSEKALIHGLEEFLAKKDSSFLSHAQIYNLITLPAGHRHSAMEKSFKAEEYEDELFLRAAEHLTGITFDKVKNDSVRKFLVAQASSVVDLSSYKADRINALCEGKYSAFSIFDRYEEFKSAITAIVKIPDSKSTQSDLAKVYSVIDQEILQERLQIINNQFEALRKNLKENPLFAKDATLMDKLSIVRILFSPKSDEPDKFTSLMEEYQYKQAALEKFAGEVAQELSVSLDKFLPFYNNAPASETGHLEVIAKASTFSELAKLEANLDAELELISTLHSGEISEFIKPDNYNKLLILIDNKAAKENLIKAFKAIGEDGRDKVLAFFAPDGQMKKMLDDRRLQIVTRRGQLENSATEGLGLLAKEYNLPSFDLDPIDFSLSPEKFLPQYAELEVNYQNLMRIISELEFDLRAIENALKAKPKETDDLLALQEKLQKQLAAYRPAQEKFEMQRDLAIPKVAKIKEELRNKVIQKLGADLFRANIKYAGICSLAEGCLNDIYSFNPLNNHELDYLYNLQHWDKLQVSVTNFDSELENLEKEALSYQDLVSALEKFSDPDSQKLAKEARQKLQAILAIREKAYVPTEPSANLERLETIAKEGIKSILSGQIIRSFEKLLADAIKAYFEPVNDRLRKSEDSSYAQVIGLVSSVLKSDEIFTELSNNLETTISGLEYRLEYSAEPEKKLIENCLVQLQKMQEKLMSYKQVGHLENLVKRSEELKAQSLERIEKMERAAAALIVEHPIATPEGVTPTEFIKQQAEIFLAKQEGIKKLKSELETNKTADHYDVLVKLGALELVHKYNELERKLTQASEQLDASFTVLEQGVSSLVTSQEQESELLLAYQAEMQKSFIPIQQAVENFSTQYLGYETPVLGKTNAKVIAAGLKRIETAQEQLALLQQKLMTTLGSSPVFSIVSNYAKAKSPENAELYNQTIKGFHEDLAGKRLEILLENYAKKLVTDKEILTSAQNFDKTAEPVLKKYENTLAQITAKTGAIVELASRTNWALLTAVFKLRTNPGINISEYTDLSTKQKAELVALAKLLKDSKDQEAAVLALIATPGVEARLKSTQEAASLEQAKIITILENHPDNPVAQRYQYLNAEITESQQAEINAETNRRNDLGKLSSDLLKQKLLQIPGLNLKPGAVDQLNLALANPATKIGAFSSLLKAAIIKPKTIALTSNLFNQLRKSEQEKILSSDPEKGFNTFALFVAELNSTTTSKNAVSLTSLFPSYETFATLLRQYKPGAVKKSQSTMDELIANADILTASRAAVELLKKRYNQFGAMGEDVKKYKKQLDARDAEIRKADANIKSWFKYLQKQFNAADVKINVLNEKAKNASGAKNERLLSEIQSLIASLDSLFILLPKNDRLNIAADDHPWYQQIGRIFASLGLDKAEFDKFLGVYRGIENGAINLLQAVDRLAKANKELAGSSIEIHDSIFESKATNDADLTQTVTLTAGKPELVKTKQVEAKRVETSIIQKAVEQKPVELEQPEEKFLTRARAETKSINEAPASNLPRESDLKAKAVVPAAADLSFVPTRTNVVAQVVTNIVPTESGNSVYRVEAVAVDKKKAEIKTDLCFEKAENSLVYKPDATYQGVKASDCVGSKDKQALLYQSQKQLFQVMAQAFVEKGDPVAMLDGNVKFCEKIAIEILAHWRAQEAVHGKNAAVKHLILINGKEFSPSFRQGFSEIPKKADALAAQYRAIDKNKAAGMSLDDIKKEFAGADAKAAASGEDKKFVPPVPVIGEDETHTHRLG